MSIRVTKRGAAAFAVAAALTLPAGTASAVILVAGSNALPGTTSAAEPQLAGLVVEDEATDVSFAIGSGVFSATVQSRVVLSDDGTYDFYWRIRDTEYTGTDAGALGSFRIGAFGLATVGLNGNYRTDGLGSVGPDTAFAFGPGPFEAYVNFNFADGLRAGTESYFMFLDTQATSYRRSAIFDLTNVGQTQISDTFSTFGVGVPEPAAWALMIAGFGLAGHSLRRSRRSAAAA